MSLIKNGPNTIGNPRGNNIHAECPDAPAADLEDVEREQWPVEARFARAYYYYQLVQLYGPVMILGDELPTSIFRLKSCNVPETAWRRREFIISELRECEKHLPVEQTPQYYGKPTKGACKAIISELTLFYARPLFNGNKLYANIRNKDGKELFPGIANVDMDRWKAAAAAAKEIIDMNEYELYKVESNGEIDPLKSYQVFSWNYGTTNLSGQDIREDIMHEFIQPHVLPEV